MQRIAIPAVLTLLAIVPAKAGPLDLRPEAQPDTAFAQVFAPPPASTRGAQARQPAQNYGGGFFEMLFAGPNGPPAAPQYAPQRYGPAPTTMQPPDGPAYYRSQPEPRAVQPALLEQPGRRSFDPKYARQEVEFDGKEKPGTIIINTNERFLYLVQGGGRATRYGIGVGRPGFAWAGVHHVTNKREWPDWTPPDDMLRRRPDLPRHMEGGPENPLGARAMYLGSTLYRIHGSNEPWTIGQAVSSGCIRMRNEDVIDLYEKVRVGTKVVVI